MNQRLGAHIANYVSALVFLIFPMSSAIHPTSIWDGILDWSAIVIYIICTFYFMECQHKSLVLMWLILLMSISYFTHFIDPGCILFYFFPVSILAFRLNQKVTSLYGLLLIGSFIVNVVIVQINIQNVSFNLIPFIVLAGMMLLSNDFFAQQNRLQQKLNDKNKELALMAGELERSRISQDLHDSLGQVFSTLSVKSELAEKLVDHDVTMAKAELKEINALAKSSLFSVRSIVDKVNRATIEEEVEQASQLLENAGITFDYQVQVSTMDEEQNHELVMLIRELVNNVIKHSDADYVYLDLQELNEHVLLLFKDNGKGLAHPDTELKSISSRIEKLGGMLRYLDTVTGFEISIEMEK